MKKKKEKSKPEEVKTQFPKFKEGMPFGILRNRERVIKKVFDKKD